MKPSTTPGTRVIPSGIHRDAVGVPLPADGPVTQPTDPPGETRRFITQKSNRIVVYLVSFADYLPYI